MNCDESRFHFTLSAYTAIKDDLCRDMLVEYSQAPGEVGNCLYSRRIAVMSELVLESPSDGP